MEEIIMNKKQYIIPVAEVIEIKSNQFLLTTSTMEVNTTDTLESSEILSREYEIDE